MEMQCGQSKGDHLAVRAVGVAWLCLSGGECPSQGYPGAARRLGRDGEKGIWKWMGGWTPGLSPAP